MKWRELPGIIVTNLIAYPLMVGWSALCFPLFWLLFPVVKAATGWTTEKATRYLVWAYGRGWVLLTMPFTRFRVSPYDPAWFKKPSMLVLNHHSFFDTFMIGVFPFLDLALAVRAWPFKMPWFRPMMKMAGYLNVESMTFEETIARSREILSTSHVVFFPEGHRSRDGKLGRFHAGGFRIAVDAGVPVVPICVTGTDVFLPPSRWWLKPATIRVKVLPPIDVTRFGGELAHRKVLTAARKAIEAELILVAPEQVLPLKLKGETI